MFALGLLSWLYGRPTENPAVPGVKFGRAPEILGANLAAFEAGWSFGETTEMFAVRYEVRPAPHLRGLPEHLREPRAVLWPHCGGSVRPTWTCS